VKHSQRCAVSESAMKNVNGRSHDARPRPKSDRKALAYVEKVRCTGAREGMAVSKPEEFEWKSISSLCVSLNRLTVLTVSCKTRRAAAGTLTESAADVPMPPYVMLNWKGRTRVRSGGKRSNPVR
jgi:hypothetical protein